MAKNKIAFIEKSENTFDITWNNMLAGTIVVPNNLNEPIEFQKNLDVNYYYTKLIARHLYKKFERDICISGSKKTFTFGAKNFDKQTKNTQHITDTEWKKYNNILNKNIGKYREFDSNGKIGIEVIFNKTIKAKDVLFEFFILLKKYSVVKFSIKQVMDKPVYINNTMSQSTLESIVVCALTQKSESDEEPNTNYNTVDQNPRIDIDPMILAKALTLICGPKQSLDDAKAKAQQKANEQYIYIKLLDKDSKFICNIYPTISKKEHEKFIKEKIQRDLGKQTLQRIGQFINQKEMGD